MEFLNFIIDLFVDLIVDYPMTSMAILLYLADCIMHCLFFNLGGDSN